MPLHTFYFRQHPGDAMGAAMNNKGEVSMSPGQPEPRTRSDAARNRNLEPCESCQYKKLRVSAVVLLERVTHDLIVSFSACDHRRTALAIFAAPRVSPVDREKQEPINEGSLTRRVNLRGAKGWTQRPTLRRQIFLHSKITVLAFIPTIHTVALDLAMTSTASLVLSIRR